WYLMGLHQFVATGHSTNAREETMSRRARELTVDQTALVGVVRKVARQRSKINTDYVMAILRAREEGATFGAIAEAAGTSSQAVQEIVRRHGPGSAANRKRESQTRSDPEETRSSRSRPLSGVFALPAT